jgi:hypothetical protein
MSEEQLAIEASLREAGIPQKYWTMKYPEVYPPYGGQVAEWIYGDGNWQSQIMRGRGAIIVGDDMKARTLFMLMAYTMHASSRGVWLTHPVGLAQAIRKDEFPENGFKSLFLKRFVDSESEMPLSGWTKELVCEQLGTWVQGDLVSCFFEQVNGQLEDWWPNALCQDIKDNSEIFGWQ